MVMWWLFMNEIEYKKFKEQEIKLSSHANYNINKKEKETIESYMSLMKISDNALKELIKYFKKRSERVIILFFGEVMNIRNILLLFLEQEII